MQTLNSPNKTPPGGYKFFVIETKRWVPPAASHPYGHTSMFDLMDELRKHYAANHIEMPPNIGSLIESQICAHLPGGWCNEVGVPVHSAVTPSSYMTFHALKEGTETLLRWLGGGMKFVDQAEADRRAQICIGCHWNLPAAGCTSCNMPALHRLIDTVRGNHRTPFDSALNACGVCSCSLKAKVFFPKETLRHTEVQRQSFPDFCWAK